MAKYTLAKLKDYQSNLELLRDKSPSLLNLLEEIYGLRANLVSGAGANTNIAIAGIVTADTLFHVLEFPATWNIANFVDRTSIASITSDGNIQLTSSTSGNKLLVLWYNKDNA